MKNILIIGASRGLGFEFVRQYRQAGDKVIATCRRVGDEKKLAALGAVPLRLDATHRQAGELLADALGRKTIDIAIYNAGVLGTRDVFSTEVSRNVFDDVMHANVMGAMQLLPVMAKRLSKKQGKLVIISSIMGSIGGMENSYASLYRVSKAAANAVARLAALEYGSKGIVTLSLHPGWVKTDMGGPDAEITPEVSISGMRKVIDAATEKHNGKFLDYQGKEIVW